jgi:hypothetical protein
MSDNKASAPTRRAWIAPELRKLEAGQAEAAGISNADGNPGGGALS